MSASQPMTSEGERTMTTDELLCAALDAYNEWPSGFAKRGWIPGVSEHDVRAKALLRVIDVIRAPLLEEIRQLEAYLQHARRSVPGEQAGETRYEVWLPATRERYGIYDDLHEASFRLREALPHHEHAERALGESGEFPAAPPERRGAYWWRAVLRERYRDALNGSRPVFAAESPERTDAPAERSGSPMSEEGVRCVKCRRWHSGFNNADARTDVCEDCARSLIEPSTERFGEDETRWEVVDDDGVRYANEFRQNRFEERDEAERVLRYFRSRNLSYRGKPLAFRLVRAVTSRTIERDPNA